MNAPKTGSECSIRTKRSNSQTLCNSTQLLVMEIFLHTLWLFNWDLATLQTLFTCLRALLLIFIGAMC